MSKKDKYKNPKRPHLYDDYNRRGNDLLNCEDEEEFEEYVQYLCDLYENNPQTSLRAICKREQERGHMVYPDRLRRILKRRGVKLRPPGKRKVTERGQIRFVIDKLDKQWLEELDKLYDDKKTKREFVMFGFDLVKGNPTKHLVMFIDPLKPVVFLWHPKYLRYIIIAEELSAIEKNEIEELAELVEQQESLEPVKAYADDHNLTWMGDTWTYAYEEE